MPDPDPNDPGAAVFKSPERSGLQELLERLGLAQPQQFYDPFQTVPLTLPDGREQNTYTETELTPGQPMQAQIGDAQIKPPYRADIGQAVLKPQSQPQVQIGEAQMKRSPFDASDLQGMLSSDPRYKPWYDEFTQKNGGPPNLNDPDYDYRAAVQNGVVPQRDVNGDNTYHWSSSAGGKMLKSENHPTAWMEHFMQATGKDPRLAGVKDAREGAEYVKRRGSRSGKDEHVRALQRHAEASQ